MAPTVGGSLGWRMLCRQAEIRETQVSQEWGWEDKPGSHSWSHSQQELGQEAIANQTRASGSNLVTG